MQVVAPGVFHLNRQAAESIVFDLKRNSIRQAQAAKVFHLDRHATERTSAAKFIHLYRRDLAPSVIHLIYRLPSGAHLHPHDFSSHCDQHEGVWGTSDAQCCSFLQSGVTAGERSMKRGRDTAA